MPKMLQVTLPYPRVPPPPPGVIIVEKNTRKHSVQEDCFLCLKTQPLIFQKCLSGVPQLCVCRRLLNAILPLASCFLLGFKSSKEAAVKVEQRAQALLCLHRRGKDVFHSSVGV